MADQLTPEDLIFVGECFGDAFNLTDLSLPDLGDMSPDGIVALCWEVEAQMRAARLRMDVYD